MIRKFIKNSTWVVGSNVIAKVINFLTLGFMARVLGPDQLGFYNAIQNTGNYVNMMSSLGTLMVAQRVGARIKEIGKERVSETFSNIFTLYLLLNVIAACCIIFFPAYFFNLLLDAKGEIDYIYFISIIIVLNAVGQIPLYLIMGLEEFKKYGLRNIISAVIILGVSAFFIAIMEDNNRAAYIGLLISFLFNALVTGWVFYTVIQQYQIHLKLTLRWRVIKEVVFSGFIYFVGNTLLGAIVGLVTISLFYKHLTSFEYGFTRIGNAFGVVLSIVPAAIQPVTISMLSVHHERNTYLKSLQIRMIPFFSTLLLVILAFNMELILTLFFGKQYGGARDIVFGMILVQIPYLYLGLINNYQVGAGNLNFVGVVASIGCLVVIACSFYLVPRYGVKGYFVAMYLATFLALGLMAFKEYYKQKKLSRTDLNTCIIIGIIILLSFLMMYILPDMLRIPMTLLVLGLTLLVFWKYGLEEGERVLFANEYRKRITAWKAK